MASIGGCATSSVDDEGNGGPTKDAAAADASAQSDASVAGSDAMVPPDDAGCTSTQMNLLSNPSFDNGPGGGWTSTTLGLPSNVIFDQVDLEIDADTPAHAAWLGGLEIGGEDVLSQDISIPPGAGSFVITGKIRILSEDIFNESDTLTVKLRDQGGTVLETLSDPTTSCGGCTWSNDDTSAAFVPFQLIPIGDYGGQTIELEFESDLDLLLVTSFFLDSLVAQVTTCQ